MLSEYISIPLFLVSFAIGLFFVYMIGPDSKTIFIYPSPDVYNKILYKDKSGTCFQITPKEIQCPINPFTVSEFPVQT